VLASVPQQVTLVFSEPVTPAGAGIDVYDPSGHQVASAVTSRGAVLSAAVRSPASGTYVVLWQVFSADTHPSRGAFEFSAVAPSANPYSTLLSAPTAGTSTPLGLAVQAVARWVHFAGFALTFGVVAYGVLTRRRMLGGLVGTGLVLLVVAEPLALLGQLASLSFDADTALAVLGSSFGRILFLRLAAAVVAWTLIATDRPWPVLATGGVIAVLDGLTAHAIPGLPLSGQALVAVHVGAMGLWTGGLIAFVLAPDPRFPRYAAATFGVAVATGLVLGLVHTKLGTTLLTSDYGRALVLKVALVLAAAAFALTRRRRTEAMIAVAVMGSAALVAALPPPL
jgi:copper transport protein